MIGTSLTLIVMGNAPSLREIDFDILRGEDTFGLNAAYRGYDRDDLGTRSFWPTYYGCFDYVVSASHMAAFFGLMEQPNPIQQFFWILPALDHPRAYLIDLIRDQRGPREISRTLGEFHDLGNSGANAAQVGVCLGYKRIILVGVDANYVEEIPGTVRDGNVLCLCKTPKKNPNYWFPDYQRAGDRFNLPRADTFQRPGWERFAALAERSGIDVLNCSPGSSLDCFPKMTLEAALGLDEKPAKNPGQGQKNKGPRMAEKSRSGPAAGQDVHKEQKPADPLGLLPS